jgi:hypothetical protein
MYTSETIYISSSIYIKMDVCLCIILPVVLYGREAWSLTLWEEDRLGVFGNGAEEDIWTEER